MYQLLLVSDKEEVRALYADFSEWEKLGFERPVIVASAEEGALALDQSHFDAVSSLLSVNEGKKFFSCVSRRPELLGMETARDEVRLRREIGSARRALSTRDAERRTQKLDDYTRMMQVEFFRELLRGVSFEPDAIDERVLSLKMKTIMADRPVAMASFRLPQGEYFLSEVWHYGRERLENALRNIFENGDDQMYFVLLIINPHHMRLLGMPSKDMDVADVQMHVSEHLARCSTSLETFFELTLDVKRIVGYDSLYALSYENSVRMAH